MLRNREITGTLVKTDRIVGIYRVQVDVCRSVVLDDLVGGNQVLEGATPASSKFGIKSVVIYIDCPSHLPS